MGNRQDIAAIEAPSSQKDSKPSLTQRQPIDFLEAIPAEALQRKRDLALMSVLFLTGCRVSAVTAACLGHWRPTASSTTSTSPRSTTRGGASCCSTPPGRYWPTSSEPASRMNREGPLFRPLMPDGTGFVRRNLDRETPWRLVKKYSRAAGIDPDRLGQRGIGILTQDRDP